MQHQHFFFDRTNKSQAFRFEVELNEPIDEAVLLQALKKTLLLFPHAACRPVITADKKHVAMAPNPAEPVIYHDFSPAALGTDETNGYLFRIIAKENLFFLSIFHAMFDAHGAHLFLIHLLYFYLTALGHAIDPQGMLYTPDDLKDPNVTASLEEKLAEYGIDHGYTEPFAPMRDRVFHDTREDELYDTDLFSLTGIRIPFARLKQCTRDLNTTPLLLMYVLCAQAMRETADVGDQIIHCCYAADIRSRLNSRSQTEFGSLGSMYFTPETAQLPLEQQLAAAKEQFDEVMAGDNILYAAKGALDGYVQMTPYIDFTKQEALQPMLSQKGKETSATFFLTNMGLLRFPADMMPFLKDVLIFGTPAKYDPTIGMHTFNGTLYIILAHNTTDDSHMERCLEKLKALGVDSEIIFKRTMKMDYLGKLSREGSDT